MNDLNIVWLFWMGLVKFQVHLFNFFVQPVFAVVVIGEDGFVKFIYQLIYTLFKLLLHFPYPIQYIRHWNEIIKWNWGEKRGDDKLVLAPNIPRCPPEKSRNKRRFWCLMCRMVKFVGIKCSHYLELAIPLVLLVSVLWELCGCLSGWPWAGQLWGWCWAVCAVQGWLDHGSKGLTPGGW